MGHFPEGTLGKVDLNLHPRDGKQASERPVRF